MRRAVRARRRTPGVLQHGGGIHPAVGATPAAAPRLPCRTGRFPPGCSAGCPPSATSLGGGPAHGRMESSPVTAFIVTSHVVRGLHDAVGDSRPVAVTTKVVSAATGNAR